MEGRQLLSATILLAEESLAFSVENLDVAIRFSVTAVEELLEESEDSGQAPGTPPAEEPGPEDPEDDETTGPHTQAAVGITISTRPGDIFEGIPATLEIDWEAMIFCPDPEIYLLTGLSAWFSANSFINSNNHAGVSYDGFIKLESEGFFIDLTSSGSITNVSHNEWDIAISGGVNILNDNLITCFSAGYDLSGTSFAGGTLAANLFDWHGWSGSASISGQIFGGPGSESGGEVKITIGIIREF